MPEQARHMEQDQTFRRLALIYSDGSVGVFPPEATLDKAREEREFVDRGDKNHDHRTRIGEVAITLLHMHPADDAAPPDAPCPTCRHAIKTEV